MKRTLAILLALFSMFSSMGATPLLQDRRQQPRRQQQRRQQPRRQQQRRQQQRRQQQRRQLPATTPFSEEVLRSLGVFQHITVVPNSYVFSVDSFSILNTRSRHTDTDYVSIDVAVDDHVFRSPVRAMGDLNNGNFAPRVSVGPITITSPTAKVVVNYSIVNAGHGDPSKIKEAISTGSEAALKSADIREPWKSIASAVIGLGNLLFFADCDGPVATEQRTFTGEQIIDMAQPKWAATKEFAGTDSPSGCGSNSRYTVTWSISRH
jgi:hypothetical protein